ncbi:MAG: pyridoxine 5'-phosphate synthase [Chitinispirillaceae bacterium]
MATLGVNIDHIATIRQARKSREPDPVQAAVLAELAGAHGITAHLREDRRHIQDRDIYMLKQTVSTHLNMEMAATNEMVQIAIDVTPYMATLVPEKREEQTTEGGLTVRGKESELAKVVESLQEHNILVSLFIDPDIQQIKAAAKTGATHVELHTGYYANARRRARLEELAKLQDCAIAAHKLGLNVNAGHGLDYQNVERVARLEHIAELNIGHSIVARASLVGLDKAVRDMISLID